jgi:hypothetical protein
VNESPGSKSRTPNATRKPPSKPSKADPATTSKTANDEKPTSNKKARPESRPSQDSSAGVDAWEPKVQEVGQTDVAARKDHQKVFDDVRNGLNSGNISSFSELLGPQVHVNLRGGESGYFSSSQAYYVLEKYLRSNRFSGLQFGTMDQSGDTPFATGRADLDQKGMKEGAQVYVSLSKAGGRWVISQIKIY